MKILADSSVWIEHFRHDDDRFAAHLAASRIVCHPDVLTELALGSLSQRQAKLSAIERLVMLPRCADAELWHLIETRRWWSRGIGAVDLQLLASATLARTKLWTLDRRLDVVAREAGIAFDPLH